MSCNCDKPKIFSKKSCEVPSPVLEIKNEECPILFHTIEVDGTIDDNPATIGAYRNVLVAYKADGTKVMYNSDGIPSVMTGDSTFDSLVGRPRYDDEYMNSNTNIPNVEETAEAAVEALDETLAPVAKSGNYSDLSGQPVIGDATLTIEKNGEGVGTFTANSTDDATINISVPVDNAELTNGAGYAVSANLANVAFTGAYSDLSGTPVVDADFSSASTNAVQNATITNALNTNLMSDLAVSATPSVSTVVLDSTKDNLATGTSATNSISLPVASTTQAGVMSKALYDALAQNTQDLNAIKNGSVAITGISASPSQQDITDVWKLATGFDTVINGARVYDIDNNKVWTYYTNDSTWHEASNTTQVTISTFTNSSEGMIKGSTTDGQVYAESDGTGSVNGWDTLTTAVGNNTSKLSTIAQGAEVNVQADWTEADNTSDAYIQNKPTNVSAFNNDAGYAMLTVSTTDIGAGAPLAAGTLYGVYV